MRYQVPQFIEIEDKIFGPLTIKQFIYLAGGGALCYLVYALVNAYLPIYLTIALMLPFAGFASALAFYKVNGKPFIDVVESATKYYLGSKLYIWKKEPKKVTQEEETRQDELLSLIHISEPTRLLS
ncbi:TPA: hypothetical protein DCQ44_00065, partial [Candidatus Taylorbacteria bacterium]|nr:hypothetical protein [Candidatus Taylorbacteria bacterium]